MGIWAALLFGPAGFYACVGDAPTPGTPDGDAATTVDSGSRDAPSNSDATAADTGTGDTGTPVGAPGAPASVAAAAVPVVVNVSTLAGSVTGAAGSVDGAGAAATFFEPYGLATDSNGFVYVADKASSRIRKISPAGVVTTLAGSTSGYLDGTGSGAQFSLPLGLVVDATFNVYVADAGNNRIRKVAPTGVVTTYAGSGVGGYVEGNGPVAAFNGIANLAIDGIGNLYAVDQTNQRIRIVTPTNPPVVSYVAGSGISGFADGTGTGASFRYPYGIGTLNGDVILADSSNYRIRKITSGGVVTTLAGTGAPIPFSDGTGAAAHFSSPQGLALDAAGNAYVADQGFHRIRKVTPAGVVTTLAGSGAGSFNDGLADVAQFNSPAGVAVDANDNVFVADLNNRRIRKITSEGIKQLKVTWTAGSAGGSAITGYTAIATATSQTPRMCTTTGATTCTIAQLTRGVAYTVTVTATNASGSSPASAPATGTPN